MKNNNGNAWIIVAAGFLILALIFAACITSAASSNAEQEPEEEEVKVEEIHDIPAPPVEQIVQPVLDPIEVQGQEALQQVPPLTKSGGVGTDCGYKFTYYSSKVLYHYRTAEGRLDNNGCYRAGDGNQWCFVISMNSSYGYMGQTIQFSFGPCIVLDSGCAQGVVDLYVNG